jgi:type I restriction enzyme S subunit
MIHFSVHLDYETSERSGAGGMFQVISLTDAEDNDRTNLIDQGIHFHNLDELAAAIAKKLGKTPAEIELDEV